ncbi:Ribosomal protein L30, bacterial-type [Candidatus Magnetoovum chiemensis]|nr:Ribosomal protein L30, bacterial-type [Candidatus Magnetoovum chiemensis]
MLKITLKKSCIAVPKNTKKIVAAMGLKKIGSTVERKDIAAVRGMLYKISHLVEVEKIETDKP